MGLNFTGMVAHNVVENQNRLQNGADDIDITMNTIGKIWESLPVDSNGMN